MLTVSFKSKAHIEVVRLLLKAGASLNLSSDEGDTALILASFNNNIRAVRVLLDYGAETNGIIAGINLENREEPPESLGKSSGSTDERLTFSDRLRQSTANLTMSLSKSSSSMTQNTNAHTNDIFPRQSELGHVNTPDEPLWVDSRNIHDGDSAVSLACELGHLDVLKALIATAGHHLDLSVRTVKKGDTPLCLAAASGTPEIVSYLLSSHVLEGDFRVGLDPYATNYKSLNALDIAKNVLASYTEETPRVMELRAKRSKVIDILESFFEGGGVPLKSMTDSIDSSHSTSRSHGSSIDTQDLDVDADDSVSSLLDGKTSSQGLGESLVRRPSLFRRTVGQDLSDPSSYSLVNRPRTY